MPDIEKVITALEVCKSADHTCEDCPYNGETCTNTLSSDALALLKEQEERIEKLKEANAMLENALLEDQ